MKLLKLLVASAVIYSCQSPAIVDKPITFDQTRRELSLQYLKEHHGLEMDEPVIDPKMIVVHWTGSGTFEQLFKTFDPPELAGRPGITSASSLNVSSQFSIDRDGTIYQLLPDTVFARHVIGLNYCAIGIENVGDGDQFPLTDAQLRSNEKLIRYLKEKHPEIEYLIGHYEYNDFRSHPLFKETDATYRTEKTDPGQEFMQKLRTNLKELNLKGTP